MSTLSLNGTTPRVLAMRQKQQNTVDGYMEYLAMTYPLFQAPKPMRIGILAELLKTRPEGVSVRIVRKTLTKWVRNPDYIQRVANGSKRYDLHGQAVEDIQPEHREHARQMIERYRISTRNDSGPTVTTTPSD
jgi:sRNA-binding protein